MGSKFLILFLFFLFPAIAMSQISMGGNPVSDRTLVGLKSATNIPKVQLKALNIERLIAERDTGLLFPTYGIVTDTLIDIKKSGIMDRVAGGGKIWRLRISNETAKSIQIYLKRFVVPEGGKIFLYDDGKQEIAGAFTRENMQYDSTLIIADFRGNHTILEYYEPELPEFEGSVIIGAIGQAYIDIFDTEAAEGFVNVNCPEGKDAQLIKHAVCRITFIMGSSQGFCSGALINNANQDGKPYFLTAHHCLSTSTVASTLVAYFNYETTCQDEPINSLTLSGSTLLSTGAESDYTLLLLNTKPSAAYQPYYAGWDVTGEETDSVTSVHIPYQQYKKISIDYDNIITYPYTISWEEGSDSPANSHWLVYFDTGTTSEGSSGSPIFNNKNQIIGQLHGGGDEEDLYGKLSYSYTYSPTTLSSIKTYLDPQSTNIKKLNGYIPTGNLPDAFFVSGFEQVCLNEPIRFTDYSVFGPYDMKWVVDPPTVVFADGTDSTSANPLIQFVNKDEYNVTLKLSVGGNVLDTESMQIIAGTDLKITVENLEEAEICDCDFESFQLAAMGANDFTWEIWPDDMDKISLLKNTGDTITVLKKAGYTSDSTYPVRIKVIGTQATCADTVLFQEQILKPSNDNMANAIEIGYGRSDVYSNVCATDEANEPVPPNTSCTSQDAWCECTMGDIELDDILESSVWFKFIPLKTGNISISSAGFDNQIALYKADTYGDLITGNYVLVGANDDRSDMDFRPLIKSEEVVAGESYWIQVDGSACGAEDDFYIIISDLTNTETDLLTSVPFKIYPLPAHDQIWIHYEGNKPTTLGLKIYNLAGACIYNRIVESDGTDISVSLADWDPGMYVMMINDGLSNYVSKFIKE